MCQNVGTLFLFDVVLWMATDPEMGECKMSKTYSWPGPSPRSTIRDKRQPRVININLINIMVTYWRKYLYIKGRERGLARWVLNFHLNTKRGRGGRWGKKLFLSYVQELSFISVGRPRLGTQPRVCDAHFTFPCLLETIHKSITLDQSSHIVTLAEFCRSKYFTILLRNCILGYIFWHKKRGLEDTFNFEGFS